MITYKVSYRVGNRVVCHTLSEGEFSHWWGDRHHYTDWLVIYPPKVVAKRIAPSYPKRWGGQLEGHPIKEGYHDRHGDNCRQFERVEDTPPMRRTDVIAAQSGGLGPVELMRKANPSK